MSPDAGPAAPLRRGRARPRTIDCEVHHALRSLKDLHPYLSRRWRDHLDSYGTAAGSLAPPEHEGPDLERLRVQLLDRYDLEYGLLHLLAPPGVDQRNQELGAALCRALNEWVVEHWTSREKRLKAAITVPGEDAEAAVAEIERWAGHAGFVQITLLTQGLEPLGRRRYWPVYEAAAHHGLPVGLHGAGCQAAALTQQAMVVSLVTEGVFELYPSLRVVMSGAGFAWVPSLRWRLDAAWVRMREEVPHLTERPSETIGRHFWFTARPVDAPERPEVLRRVIGWVGWDRLLFATGYPLAEVSDPVQALAIRMSEEERRMVFGENARLVYQLS